MKDKSTIGLIILGVILITLGGLLITHAMNHETAMGGLIAALLGIAVMAIAAWRMES